MFRLVSIANAFGLSEAGMAVSDYVPIFFTNRLHLAGASTDDGTIMRLIKGLLEH